MATLEQCYEGKSTPSLVLQFSFTRLPHPSFPLTSMLPSPSALPLTSSLSATSATASSIVGSEHTKLLTWQTALYLVVALGTVTRYLHARAILRLPHPLTLTPFPSYLTSLLPQSSSPSSPASFGSFGTIPASLRLPGIEKWNKWEPIQPSTFPRVRFY